MKRLLSVLMLVCLLLSFPVLIPVGAEESESVGVPDWAVVKYRPAVEEGAEPLKPTALDPAQRLTVSDRVEILFERGSIVKLNGKEIPSGTVIEKAGRYSIEVLEGDKPALLAQSVSYMVEILPNSVFVANSQNGVSLVNGAVFQYYPVLLCENAHKIEISHGTKTVEYASGHPWPADFANQFGEFTVEIKGVEATANGGGYTSLKRYTFSIYPCTASKSFDEQLGLYALKISVGNFEDLEVRLDGTEVLTPNEVKVVTAVGEHYLDVYINGEKLSQDSYSVNGIPYGDKLALRITMELDATSWEYPREWDFSRWDATVLMDGAPVSGCFLVVSHGEHVFTVVDADGNAVQNCFSVKVGEADAVVSDSFTFTFDNPHYTYIYFILIPAAVLLIAAIFFLILRRTIV